MIIDQIIDGRVADPLSKLVLLGKVLLSGKHLATLGGTRHLTIELAACSLSRSTLLSPTLRFLRLQKNEQSEIKVWY